VGAYRVFFLDKDGRVCDGLPFEAASDEDAVESARRLSNCHGIEIWQLDRKVAHLGADPIPPYLA
jgi:hypothetical protein